jgi:hypothetical protein
MTWADEVPDEHHVVSDQEAAGHQRWGGQPHKVFARGVVQRIGLFQGQNRIKMEKFNLNIHNVSLYIARTVVLDKSIYTKKQVHMFAAFQDSQDKEEPI